MNTLFISFFIFKSFICYLIDSSSSKSGGSATSPGGSASGSGGAGGGKDGGGGKKKTAEQELFDLAAEDPDCQEDMPVGGKTVCPYLKQRAHKKYEYFFHFPFISL